MKTLSKINDRNFKYKKDKIENLIEEAVSKRKEITKNIKINENKLTKGKIKKTINKLIENGKCSK